VWLRGTCHAIACAKDRPSAMTHSRFWSRLQVLLPTSVERDVPDWFFQRVRAPTLGSAGTCSCMTIDLL